MPKKGEPEIIQAGPMDPDKKNSPIAEGPPPEEKGKGGICYFNGKAYPAGTLICSDGTLLRCYSDGTWGEVGEC